MRRNMKFTKEVSLRSGIWARFQDKGGSGYVLLHGGDFYRLSDDSRSIIEHVHKANIADFESPTLFRKDSLYYFLDSHLIEGRPMLSNSIHLS